MPKKTGYKKTIIRPQFRKPTKFELKWGEPAHELAERENVLTATIHNRVKNYGSPFQRTTKPTLSEDLCGKTMQMLTDELNLSQVAIQQRIFKYKNPYICNNGEIALDKKKHKPYKARAELWLMPEHPCYEEWVEQKAKVDAKLRAEAKKLEQQKEQKRLKRQAGDTSE